MAFRRELALRWRISRRVPVQHDRGGRIVDQWRCDVIQARRDDRTLGHVSGNSDTNPLAIIPQVRGSSGFPPGNLKVLAG
jgi:hypothetical protein